MHAFRSKSAILLAALLAAGGTQADRPPVFSLKDPGRQAHECRDNFRNKLQIIHSSDNESSFQDPNTLEEKILNYSAVTRGLQQLARTECLPSLHITAGDHTIPGPFYQASEEVFGEPGIGDIVMYNAMRLRANGMGNHEFDGGIDEFAQMLARANYPFIAANLDFSAVTLAPGTPSIRIGRDGLPCAVGVMRRRISPWCRPWTRCCSRWSCWNAGG